MQKGKGCSGSSWDKRGRQRRTHQVSPTPPPPAEAYTLTHGAHTTHTAQPVYLYPWVDIRAFCLLVTAPSAQHNTTQHSTAQHNTTRHKTTQHNTTENSTTQHNATQHNTTQHLSTPQLYPRAWCRVRSPGRQGPGTANSRCTNSVGCPHVPVPSTISRDPAAPSTGRLGPGNGQRPPVEDG